jgi:hypothetical protein
MAAAAQVPDYTASLAAFLLGDYLAQLGDPRFTEEERFERRMKLEYQLWKLEDLAPMAAYRMVGVISQTFAGDLDRRLIPAIEWYFDFLSAKNEQWLNEVSRTQLIRIWKAMPTRRLRDRALETLLWIEATIHPDQPEKSEIVRLFRDEELIAGDGELTPQGVEIAEILLREAVTSPRYPPDFPIILRYCMRVLRFSLSPIDIPDRAIVERVLRLAGDIGDPVYKELSEWLLV